MNRLLVAFAFALGLGGPAFPQQSDVAKNAKALFFDRKYQASREEWRKVAAAGGSEGTTALYWIAQCSDKLGQTDRAFKEYAEYLAQRPAGQLAEEARTSRVRIATSLYKAGRTEALSVVEKGLSDSNRTVRYFSALQMCGLGKEVGKPAIPLLQTMVSAETDPDLVERGKLCLVKLGATSEAMGQRGPDGASRWFRVQVFKTKLSKEPVVSVNMPLSLADLVLKSLPDNTRDELRKKGIDAESLFDKIKTQAPTELVDIVGDDGERVRIWIE